MARYRGPVVKKSRRLGIPLSDKAARIMEKRTNPPGQHGGRMSRKMSDYGKHLLEKQRFRYTYGLLEKQFRNYVRKAMSRSGVAGENLLQMLETRLDNMVYRAGFTNTIREARQIVTHKHIMVDGKVVNVPSFLVKPGMKIQINKKMQKNAQIREAVGKTANKTYPYLEISRPDLRFTLVSIPIRENIPVELNENMVIEYYSK
ncbi:MAG: 30S ribosomal protein S4 [Candidatus Latescibacteria bacterium]|jgi:small subunit ribosomal protein S4|nr:30S ribosomal protein S4 [Candidatus Latescibacterota bacterium]